jgi:hypothetical protein
MPKSMFRRAAVGAAAVAVVAVSAAPALAAGQASSGWRLVFSKQYPTKAPAEPFSDFTTGVALAPNDAWALGGTSVSDSQVGHPVALRWHNGAWRPTTLPAKLGGTLGAVSAPAANDVWAVSQFNGYVVHWNGKSWSIAKSWPESKILAEELTGVTAFSRTNVWVFGGAGGWPGLGTYHLQGRTWTKLKGISIDTASALSPTSMWAIADGPDHPWQSIKHYNGTKWSTITERGLASNFQMSGIIALSAKSIWVAGFPNGVPTTRPELARWDGHGWKKVTVALPATGTPNGLSADGHGGFWMSVYSQTSAWAVHISASGKVTEVRQLARNGRVVPIPGSSSLWAVGSTTKHTGTAAAIWLRGSRP